MSLSPLEINQKALEAIKRTLIANLGDEEYFETDATLDFLVDPETLTDLHLLQKIANRDNGDVCHITLHGDRLGSLVEGSQSPSLTVERIEQHEKALYSFGINLDPNLNDNGLLKLRICMAYYGKRPAPNDTIEERFTNSEFFQNSQRREVKKFLERKDISYNPEGIEKHPNPMVLRKLLSLLEEKGILTSFNINAVIEHEKPLDLYSAYDILFDSELNLPDFIIALLKHKNPLDLASILVSLKQANLLNEPNFKFVKAHQNSPDLASVLASLTQADLLNEPNFEFVKKHDNLFDLASVLVSLTQADLLNKPNFERVKEHDKLSDLASVLVHLEKERLLTQASVAHKNPHEFAQQKISNNKKIKVALAGFFAGAGIMATTLISSPATVHYLSGLFTFMPHIAPLVAAVTISAIAMALLALFVNALINVFQKANPVPQELCLSP